MKTKLLIIAIVALVSACAAKNQQGTSTTAKSESEEILAKIQQLEDDPIAAVKTGIYEEIMKFTLDSPDVMVNIQSHLTPYILNSAESDVANAERSLLLVAHMAGSVRPQLIKKINQDHPLEGVQFALKVYEKFRSQDIIAPVPEFDEWLGYTPDQLKDVVEKDPTE